MKFKKNLFMLPFIIWVILISGCSQAAPVPANEGLGTIKVVDTAELYNENEHESTENVLSQYKDIIDPPENDAVEAIELPEDSEEFQEALKDIEGDWFSWGTVDASESEYGGIPREYVHFEDRYVDTYGAVLFVGKYGRDCSRGSIKSICKIGDEYLYRIQGTNVNYSYQSRADDADTLDFFGTWEIDELLDYYSGTGSLTSKRKYEKTNNLDEFVIQFWD